MARADNSLLLAEMTARGLAGIRPGLERMRAVLAKLSSPHKRLGRVALIAGTNGKGSTAAFLEALARAAGHRTVLYTSPHLVRITERLRLDGTDIDGPTLDAATLDVLAAEERAGVELTGFELVTAAAFVAAAAHKPTVSIIEVGLGGLLDATNVVAPDVTVITPLGLDHAEYLGDSLALVTTQKLGITRPGVSCVCSRQPAEAARLVDNAAARTPFPLLLEDRDFLPGGTPAAFRYDAGGFAVPPCPLALPGAFQVQNAGLAVAAARALFALTPAAAARGLAAARWPARLESRTVAGRTVVFDGAHNPAAALALAAAWPHGPTHILYAAKEDKDAAGVLAALAPIARRFIFTRPGRMAGHEPLALAALVPDHTVEIVPAPEAALARLICAPGDNPLLCCGSFYLVGYLFETVLPEEKTR